MLAEAHRTGNKPRKRKIMRAKVWRVRIQRHLDRNWARGVEKVVVESIHSAASVVHPDFAGPPLVHEFKAQELSVEMRWEGSRG